MISRRRFVVTLAGVVSTGSGAGTALGAKTARIGFLWDSPTVWPHALAAFRQGLREAGWVEGQNLVIEFRWVEGRFERLPGLVDELVRLKVDVIVAPTSIYTGAARQATSTIPIVFASHADPVGTGHVGALARPGGNATGLTIMMSETMAKSVELLKAALPGLTKIGLIWDPATPSHRPAAKAVEDATRAMGLRLHAVPVKAAAEFDGTFKTLTQEHAGAVLVLSTPLFMGGAARLAELGVIHKLPTMFGPREHVEAGGLLSYSPDRADLYRRAAGYVDRILKGANPAELPVQRAEKFELVVNLKTARAIGVAISPAVLARADHVIE